MKETEKSDKEVKILAEKFEKLSALIDASTEKELAEAPPTKKYLFESIHRLEMELEKTKYALYGEKEASKSREDYINLKHHEQINSVKKVHQFEIKKIEENYKEQLLEKEKEMKILAAETEFMSKIVAAVAPEMVFSKTNKDHRVMVTTKKNSVF